MMSSKIPKILYGCWGLLGCYRGIKYYDYWYEEEIQKHLKNPNYYKKPEDLYSNKIGMGAIGTVVYILPFFCVFPAIKEIERLEINLRGLEDEKKKPDYYYLF